MKQKAMTINSGNVASIFRKAVKVLRKANESPVPVGIGCFYAYCDECLDVAPFGDGARCKICDKMWSALAQRLPLK